VTSSIVNDDHHYAEKETRKETYESVGDWSENDAAMH